ncbi:DUF2927 domain-containing protein [uncultured Roseobacter sp.]|uniref:DUF2927 domain-containing protein n=1 Tax=uncultured Roseobacter sp. TaxID=114847 RepID=UPI00261641F2|nr:DUF2927 domain-containing protein [uncultured Roseobacter sp.]
MAQPVAAVKTPRARPTDLAETQLRPTSEASAALRSYLVQVQAAQLNQGLLREDGGGPDTPFTADMLARNFERIVFFNEYAQALQGRGGESPLRRWDTPVRVGIVFGQSVPPSQRASDGAAIRSYARRLGQISGHPISTFGNPNFIVIVASEDDRSDALDAAAARVPGITPESLNALRSLSRDTYCAVAAYAAGSDANTYTAAVAIIRAENPSLLRLSCIHEEMAQGLGLANDSRDARPSIFNDDDEFALLTKHDALLLKMLYDPRLEAGMSAAEAAPITRIIARELKSGPL